MRKQSAVMAVAYSKLFCFIVHLFDGVLWLRLFFHTVSFRPGFTRRCFDVIRVLFPLVCYPFSPYSVRAFLMVLLMFVYFTHRPFAPFTQNNAIWSAAFSLFFFLNQYRTFFAIPSCRSYHAKIQSAALTVLFFHAASPLSVFLLCCAVQSTG